MAIAQFVNTRNMPTSRKRFPSSMIVSLSLHVCLKHEMGNIVTQFSDTISSVIMNVCLDHLQLVSIYLSSSLLFDAVFVVPKASFIVNIYTSAEIRTPGSES